VIALGITCAAALVAPAPSLAAAPGDSLPFASAIFRATHNKDDLTDNPSFAAGNLTALNQELRDAFGPKLLMAKDGPGALGTIGSLRGRVLTLLSGDGGTRTDYRRTIGYDPAVAIYASTATNSAFITAARQSGHIVRGWDFDSAGYATTPLANYPATNHPSDTWYTSLLTQSGAVS
jgi:hypothetical protein